MLTELFEVLPGRALISVSGEDAETFLENLVTCKVTGLSVQDARFGALLTPQGKIMFDFFLIATADGYVLDTSATLADDFLKRLMLYRLRAKVDLDRMPETDIAWFSGQTPDGTEFVIDDPRHPQMAKRAYGTFDRESGNGEYDHCRVHNGVPEGGRDFAYGDAYPHEVLMDQNAGVDFRKGCYVGQEVVSRMQHRGTAKKRIIQVSSTEPLPQTGTDIVADGKPAGTLGTVINQEGLALLRMDRVAKAESVLAGDVPLSVRVPDWVTFALPEKQ